jgi:hypothetical protein
MASFVDIGVNGGIWDDGLRKYSYETKNEKVDVI